MIIIKTQVEKNIVINYINAGIVKRPKPTNMRWRAFDSNMIIGAVENNNFWIQKISPHLSRCPQRYFEGKILEKEGETAYICGSFKQTNGIIAICGISTVVLLALAAYFKFNDTAATMKPIFFLLWLVLIWGAFATSPLVYRPEEQEVISFLQKIQ